MGDQNGTSGFSRLELGRMDVCLLIRCFLVRLVGSQFEWEVGDVYRFYGGQVVCRQVVLFYDIGVEGVIQS